MISIASSIVDKAFSIVSPDYDILLTQVQKYDNRLPLLFQVQLKIIFHLVLQTDLYFALLLLNLSFMLKLGN